MTGTDVEGSVVSRISAGVEALPEPVRTSFWAAVGRLLGGLAANPAAWLRRPAQAFEDTTDARTIVSKGLAEAVVDRMKADNNIMAAALDAYAPSLIRKTANRGAVASFAAEEVSRSEGGGANAKPPDEDWMNTFMRYSEDASSERLQTLFGRILAGEIVNPGTFSPSTLRSVSELTQSVATDFSWLWERNHGGRVWHGPEFERGEAWDKLTRLRDAGLVSPVPSSLFSPEFKPDPNGISIWSIGEPPFWLNVWKTDASLTEIRMINFTRAGIELGLLLPRPDFGRNLRKVAQVVPKQGVARMELLEPGKPVEMLWRPK